MNIGRSKEMSLSHMRKKIKKISKAMVDEYIGTNKIDASSTAATDTPTSVDWKGLHYNNTAMFNNKTKKPIETCHLGKGGWDYEDDLIKLKANEYSYIHEHLATLELLMSFMQPDLIVEIGTGPGHSTLAFALGCSINNRGHVITIDIEDCGQAKDLIKFDNDLNDYVTFIQSNSLKLKMDGGIDILFIDGLHTYEQVKKEIKRYMPDVNFGGVIVFHDTYNPAHPGVQKAVREFTLGKWDEWDMFEYFNCNGITILRRKEPID